jgi:hypothetical protein
MRLSLKESRTKLLNATNLDRKSGIRGPRGWYSPREGCQTVGCTAWQLAFRGVGGLRGKRDYATLAILLGCALRRAAPGDHRWQIG